eukprot:TRINITY_DN44009_c0_g1_i1.p1 TRINITY_DN44009_c0_g1~~TRINITY_DN44009_c0_g1_i1.p1  ORF type:complete len:510 (+),score=74.20 TRINITY_DN44009_c0_g1_i1:136-1665(+)
MTKVPFEKGSCQDVGGSSRCVCRRGDEGGGLDEVEGAGAATSVNLGELVLGRYRITPGTAPLGQGGLCVVWHAADASSSEDVRLCVAVKTYQPQRAREESAQALAARFSQEVETFRNLGVAPSSNRAIAAVATGDVRSTRDLFVNLIDFSSDPATGDPAATPAGRFFTVLELADDSLDQWLRRLGSNGAPLPVSVALAEVFSVVHSVAAGLGVVHARGLVHLDIKPENIMRFGQHWKIIDLEGVRPVGNGALVSADCLTPLYASPELAAFLLKKNDARGDSAVASLDGFVLHPSVDMWAFGVLLLDIAVRGRALDDDYTSMQQASLFDDGEGEPPFAAWYRWLVDPAPLDLLGIVSASAPGGELLRGGPAAAQDLFQNLLSKDPATRLSAHEVLRHPAFASLQPPSPVTPGSVTTSKTDNGRIEDRQGKRPENERGAYWTALEAFQKWDIAGTGRIGVGHLLAFMEAFGLPHCQASLLLDASRQFPSLEPSTEDHQQVDYKRFLDFIFS